MEPFRESNTIDLMGRPRKPEGEHYRTPPSSFRIPPPVKRAAQAAAKEQGEDLTEVVVRSLTEYAIEHGHPPTDQEDKT